jgi:hypothetical protein
VYVYYLIYNFLPGFSILTILLSPLLVVDGIAMMGLFCYLSASEIAAGQWFSPSCNNVAPVTNLCFGRATTRSHSSQWSKKKVAVET